jgi:hypothetical protein
LGVIDRLVRGKGPVDQAAVQTPAVQRCPAAQSASVRHAGALQPSSITPSQSSSTPLPQISVRGTQLLPAVHTPLAHTSPAAQSAFVVHATARGPHAPAMQASPVAQSASVVHAVVRAVHMPPTHASPVAHSESVRHAAGAQPSSTTPSQSSSTPLHTSALGTQRLTHAPLTHAAPLGQSLSAPHARTSGSSAQRPLTHASPLRHSVSAAHAALVRAA